MPEPLVLSEAEAQELYDYMRFNYLAGSKHPHLSRLLDRIAAHLRVQEQLLKSV